MFSKDFWKRGERLQMWLNKLKIAIIEKNTDSLNRLLDDIEHYEDEASREEALYLLREALELVHTLQDQTAADMTKIKKNLAFLKSTDTHSANKFDVTS